MAEANNLLSIKDFARLTKIKESTLRYYDDLGLFSPVKRGENSYRYYSPTQLTTINSINLLHEFDMPIKKISEVQKNRTPELVYEVLNEKEAELKTELLRLERSHNVVRTLRRHIQMGMESNESIIEVKYYEELPIVIGPENDLNGSRHFLDNFLEFCSVADQYRIDILLPIGGMFADFDCYKVDAARPTRFFSVDPKGFDKRQAGKFLSAFHRGYYGSSGDIVERMETYMREHSLKPVGPVYNIFLQDELSISDPNNYLMHATVEVADLRV